jgi:hypothetical protein
MPNEHDTQKTDSTWNEKESGATTETEKPNTKNKKPGTTTDESWDESWAEPKS